jgi:hypothetical protein
MPKTKKSSKSSKNKLKELADKLKNIKMKLKELKKKKSSNGNNNSTIKINIGGDSAKKTKSKRRKKGVKSDNGTRNITHTSNPVHVVKEESKTETIRKVEELQPKSNSLAIVGGDIPIIDGPGNEHSEAYVNSLYKLLAKKHNSNQPALTPQTTHTITDITDDDNVVVTKKAKSPGVKSRRKNQATYNIVLENDKLKIYKGKREINWNTALINQDGIIKYNNKVITREQARVMYDESIDKRKSTPMTEKEPDDDVPDSNVTVRKKKNKKRDKAELPDDADDERDSFFSNNKKNKTFTSTPFDNLENDFDTANEGSDTNFDPDNPDNDPEIYMQFGDDEYEATTEDARKSFADDFNRTVDFP